jgi:hypothetical protein
MIGFEYIFGTNENKIDNLLSKVVSTNNLILLNKYYTHYEESMDFINRHVDTISDESIEHYTFAKKYLINYGYIFFLKMDYSKLKELKYDQYSWIVSYFNEIYNNISTQLQIKFIETIEKKISHQKFENSAK